MRIGRRWRRSRPSGGRALSRYLAADERILLETRQHPFAVVAEASRAIGVLTPLALIAWGVQGVEPLRGGVARGIGDVILVAMMGIVGRLAWYVLGWELARLIVTTEKVVFVKGVLGRRVSSAPLVKVAELAVRQPPLGRLMDFGALIVDAPGGGVPLHGLGYVPDPAGIYRLVADAARRGRAREGGGKVAAPTLQQTRVMS